jgi:hypothetical protein
MPVPYLRTTYSATMTCPVFMPDFAGAETSQLAKVRRRVCEISRGPPERGFKTGAVIPAFTVEQATRKG